MSEFNPIKKSLAIEKRNNAWAESSVIPSWVDTDTVGLDQFFTNQDVAKYCHESLITFMKKDGAVISDYKFIEPSVGEGAFFDLLPEEKRIGLDVLPLKSEILGQDFLTWDIKSNGVKYATIGNPPFGYRAWLALAFINHAGAFSNYVGMVLPMAFQSDGKGSPKHRVEGLELVHSEILPQDSFTNHNGKSVKINGLWQVWKRGVNNRPKVKTCSNWIELFTVDQRKERLCGYNRMNEADYFLQRTFFKDPPSLVKCFSKVKYVCGYGIIIKKEKPRIKEILNSVDWRSYSNLAAHNCRHISMYHIQNALTDAGYSND